MEGGDQSDQIAQVPADTDMPDALETQDHSLPQDGTQIPTDSTQIQTPLDTLLTDPTIETPTVPVAAIGDMPPGGGMPTSSIAAGGPGPSAGIFATAPPPDIVQTPLANGRATPTSAAQTSTQTTTHATTQLDPTLANKLHIIPPANEQGSPTRVYINTKVTPWLLEGMKWVGANEPEKPLKWLGEYLLRKSAEVEGS